MDRHVWQGLTTVTLAALVVFSINTLSPVGNGDGLGITTIQAKKKTHRLPNLLDQQIAILVGLDINPNRVRKQSAADSSVYGTVKSDDTVLTEINEDYSYLVTSGHDKEISLFFKADKKKVTVKYTDHGEKLHTKTIPSPRLVEQSYRTERQHQQVNEYASVLRTEQLIGHRKLGL